MAKNTLGINFKVIIKLNLFYYYGCNCFETKQATEFAISYSIETTISVNDLTG